MACEITVKMKDCEKAVIEKIRVFDNVEACFQDENIDKLIEKVTKKFGQSTFAVKTTVTIKLIEE